MKAALTSAGIFTVSQAVDCSNFNGEMGCRGSQTYYPDDWSHREFQTPLKGSEHYREQYEDLGKIACYPGINYD